MISEESWGEGYTQEHSSLRTRGALQSFNLMGDDSPALARAHAVREIGVRVSSSQPLRSDILGIGHSQNR